MKILVISNLYPPDTVGGYELGCRQAVDALRALGHDVRVLTTVPRTPVETPPHVFRSLKLTDMWDYYSDDCSARAIAPAEGVGSASDQRFQRTRSARGPRRLSA